MASQIQASRYGRSLISSRVGNGNDIFGIEQISFSKWLRDLGLASKLYHAALKTVAAESEPAKTFENVHEVGALSGRSFISYKVSREIERSPRRDRRLLLRKLDETCQHIL